MARLNPKRRLLAKIKMYDQLAHNLTVAYQDDSKLQQGSVRSEQRRFDNRIGAASPPRGWNTDPDFEDGRGKGARKSAKRWGKV